MNHTHILFDTLDTERAVSFAFDVWYAHRYLPALAAASGAGAVRAYGSPVLGTYLAVLETAAPIDSGRGMPDAGASPVPLAQAQRRVARLVGERRAADAPADIVEAPLVYPVFFRVPAEGRREFDAWYDEEHLGILLACPWWPMCRRYEIVDPAPGDWTHLALHHLTDLRALQSPERDAARATPWRARLAEHDWFRGDYRVYHRLAVGAGRD